MGRVLYDHTTTGRPYVNNGNNYGNDLLGPVGLSIVSAVVIGLWNETCQITLYRSTKYSLA